MGERACPALAEQAVGVEAEQGGRAPSLLRRRFDLFSFVCSRRTFNGHGFYHPPRILFSSEKMDWRVFRADLFFYFYLVGPPWGPRRRALIRREGSGHRRKVDSFFFF